MKNKKRSIDVVSVALKFSDESDKVSFESILKALDGEEHKCDGKIFELSLYDTKIENCLLGIIVTTQDKDVPPIKDKRTGKYSPVNINPDIQGLAFGNVFLYDVSKNIFLYEINRNGCYLKQLIEFIYSVWNFNEESTRFDISFPALIRANEYKRMLQMDYYKKITIDLFNPTELLECFDEKNDSIEKSILRHNIQLGLQSNANILKIEQIAFIKKLNPLGLSRSLVKGLVDAVILYIVEKGQKRNIQTLKVEGYTYDSEDSKGVKPIDILADIFHESFYIEDIQIQSDVQESERKEGIEKLYYKILPELKDLAG